MGFTSLLARVSLGEEATKVVIGGTEKGMQDEHDEQLRILNDRGLQEGELRRLIVEMRDKGFDEVKEMGDGDEVKED